jgi:hypothetical protein
MTELDAVNWILDTRRASRIEHQESSINFRNIDRQNFFSLDNYTTAKIKPYNLNHHIAVFPLLVPQYIAQSNTLVFTPIALSNKIALYVSKFKL